MRLVRRLIRATPFAAVVVPTHDYPVYGHSAPGVGLNELQTGASVGRLVNLMGQPRLWFEGTYFYSFVENVSDEITIDLEKASIKIHSTGEELSFKPLGDVKPVVDAGGLFNYARENGMIPA